MRKRETPNVLGGILGFAWLIVILVPIYYAIVTSVRPREDYFTSNPLSLPTEFTLQPFRDVLENDFLRYFLNSTIVTLVDGAHRFSPELLGELPRVAGLG
ncbi:ABC transporter permease family protein [Brachybacterium nesterenkovii]|uniref:Sugar ABC-transporter integral membrane protein n=1 Tax=Brachybacterium nesterenkovii TaxID=47847 RepID=A0A1X6WSW2_9MICO|nr:hypothetical protein [Brachybacterium nesterenkovii]SLM87934.1 sugar ABC-transporter integral membrane protein [Brachybacterium nesterenkovii]